MSLLIASISVVILVSFTCSLLEAVVLSLTPIQIADISTRNPRIGTLWQSLKARIERPITVILFLNTAANTMGATIAGAQFGKLYGNQFIAAFSLVFTYMILQFSEILPKTIGVRFNRRIAPFVAVPLDVLITVLSPILNVIHFINKPFARKSAGRQQAATLEEISALAGLARLSNLIGPHQEKIIKRSWRLSGTPVRNVMVPAAQITFLRATQSLADALLTAHMDPHTRFPICDKDDCNNVLGYINFKEMIHWARTNPADPSLRGIIRPVHFVSPELSCAQLLEVFVDQHVHMAIVRADDNKQVIGLVTLEDIVEELVGELGDEFDRAPRMCHSLSGGTWMVGGGLPVSEMASQLGIRLSDCSGTVSAWLIRRMGRVPQRNEIYREGGLEFMIRRIRRGNVFEVMVTRSP